MSNITYMVPTEKVWLFSKLDFPSLKNLSQGMFLVSSNCNKYHWILKLLVGTYSLCPLFLIFHQMIVLQILWKMLFNSSKKLFLFLRHSNFCNFFPSFPNFPDSKGQMKAEWFMIWWTGLHKLAYVIFEITQKPLYITSSNLII